MASRQQIVTTITRAARQMGVDPKLAVATAMHESSLNPGARGAAGEVGVMQIMPQYWEDWAASRGWNIREPTGNIMAGVAILANHLQAEGGDPYKALRRYNGGPAWAKKPTTDDYAKSVLRRRAELSGEQLRSGMVSNAFPVPGGKGISPFGASRDGGSRKHKGFDIGAPRHTPVVAHRGGEVTRSVKTDNGRGFGRVVYVRGREGREYRYAHLEDVNVNVGDTVKTGQQLGTVGDSGNAATTPPHLHFEVLEDGKQIDPEPVLEGAQAVREPVRTPSLGVEGEQQGVVRTPRLSFEQALNDFSDNTARALDAPRDEVRQHFSQLADNIVRSVEEGRRSRRQTQETIDRQNVAARGEVVSEGLLGALSATQELLGSPMTLDEEDRRGD